MEKIKVRPDAQNVFLFLTIVSERHDLRFLGFSSNTFQPWTVGPGLALDLLPNLTYHMLRLMPDFSRNFWKIAYGVS